MDSKRLQRWTIEGRNDYKMKFFVGILLFVVALCALTLLLWQWSSAGRRASPDVSVLRRYRYAHRGLHGEGVPENSMAAFRRAVEHGFGAELDVHLLRDGSLAVVHDANLLRVAGEDVQVEGLTAQELSKYRLGGTSERVPLLGEVLALFDAAQLPLIIELKPVGGNQKALTDTVLQALQDHSAPYCIESFDPRAIAHLRSVKPSVVRGQLAANFAANGERPAGYSRATLFVCANLICNALSRPDFVAYRFSDRERAAFRFCRCTMKVLWTITDAQQLRWVEERGMLAIFEGFTPEAARQKGL